MGMQTLLTVEESERRHWTYNVGIIIASSWSIDEMHVAWREI